MHESNTPQSQDNTAEDTKQNQVDTSKNAKQSENSGTVTERIPSGPKVPRAPEKHATSNNDSDWRKHITPTLVVQFFLLVVTIIIACIYSGQLNQMIQSNKINREGLESVQRAFMVSRDVVMSRHIIRESGGGEHAIDTFTMPWENTGTTPATITSQAFFEGKLPTEPTEEQFARKPLLQNAVLGPKAVRNVGNVTATDIQLFGQEFPHRNEDVLKMRHQTVIVKERELHVFWGWTTYRDIIPNTPVHLTEFCEYMAGIVITNNPQSPLGFWWLPCDHHNCADKQCEDYEAIVTLAKK